MEYLEQGWMKLVYRYLGWIRKEIHYCIDIWRKNISRLIKALLFGVSKWADTWLIYNQLVKPTKSSWGIHSISKLASHFALYSVNMLTEQIAKLASIWFCLRDGYLISQAGLIIEWTGRLAMLDKQFSLRAHRSEQIYF